MKPHLNLIAQLIGVIVCTGLTKIQTSLKKWPPIFQEYRYGVFCLPEDEWGRISSGQTYLKTLEIMNSRLNDLFENEKEIYFQQDGAPPHFQVNVRNFLDRTLNQRWIGWRGSATKFPPRSPDLTPLDFYLWGTLKNTVYARKPQTLVEPKDQIEHAFKDIPLATIQMVWSVRRRYWECTVAKGDFEHVRA